jgi:hypothetical protein
MNRALRFRYSGATCRRIWLAAALVAAVGACGKHQPAPHPPSAAPHPTTQRMVAGHVTTADLRLHARLKVPAAGWM